jgi:CSLREA domain-containing protein
LLGSLLLFGLLITGCTLPTPAPCADTYAVTTTVDSNDGVCSAAHCSLREAIRAANACAGPQTITVPAGNYPLTLVGRDEDSAATGDLDITDDLTLQGAGAPSIDGVTEDRIFEIFPGATVEINQFILINGLEQLGGAIRSHGDLTVVSGSIHNNNAEVPPGGAGASSGGGIFVESGTTTLIGTDVLENYADFGGGVHNFATATFTMTGGHLAGNIASGWGGGLWNNMAATASLQDVQVYRNTANELGAGIYNNGTLEGTGVVFNENIATAEGGGAFNDEDGEMFLTSAWFTNNNGSLGGGLFNRGLLHLYQSSLTNNTALGGLGGAAYNDGAGAALLVQNTTVSSNMIVPFASPGGSGIYNLGGDLRLEFSTLAYNNADGVLNDGGSLSLRSTILAYHALGNCAGDPGSSTGYNLEDGNTCGLGESSDLLDTDPFLLWLDTNGGSNLSHALDPSSPAVDSGDPDRCIAIDQRGVARPQGLACDRGAVELEAAPPAFPFVFLLETAYCRKGPGTAYDALTNLEASQTYPLTGRDAFDTWWQVSLPDGQRCWVSDSLVEPGGPFEDLPVIPVAPAVTDTPVPGCWVQSQASNQQICVSPCPPNAKPGGACIP